MSFTNSYNTEMSLNLKAVVRYDGGAYCGWQVQPDERSVQGALQDALGQIAGEPVKVYGASRTDSGVHALGQVASFRWTGNPNIEKLRRSLSQMLAPKARIVSLEPVDEDFHARHSAQGKRYAYVIDAGTEPDPFTARYAWHVPYALDMNLLAQQAARLVGEHDFAGFGSATAEPVENTVRLLHDVRVLEGPVVGAADGGAHWRIEYSGTAFLYKMVRNMTGTLIDIARGYHPPARIDTLFAAPGPYRGYTAPAHGLFLLKVRY